MLPLILMIVAFICFVAAAAGIAAGRLNLIGAGLACWVLSQFVGTL
jgi:hypothetical protein